MNTLKMNKCFGLLIVMTIAVSGCAEYNVQESDNGMSAVDKTPSKTAKTDKAAHSPEEVKAAIAEAKMAAKRAEEVGGLWRDTSKLIKKAEAALKKNNGDKAFKVANIAKEQADLALNQTYLEKANHTIGRVKGMMSKDDEVMLRRVNEAETAYLNEEGELAYIQAQAMFDELSNPQYAKAKPATPAETQQASTESKTMKAAPAAVTIDVTQSAGSEMLLDDQYQVVSGDSLWGISGKSAIYDDPYQWPLIYKANRQKIADPDMIHPGQVLGINRDASETEIKDAINHAKKRGEWSLDEVEANDQTYLAGDDVAAR